MCKMYINNSLPSGMRSIINIIIHVAQGTFEYDVYSMYFKASAIPTLLGEKCEGSSICFTMPLFPTHRIQCLNAWCKYEATYYFMSRYIKWASVKIENKTKDLTWIHRSKFVPFCEYVGWLSRWRFWNQTLEAGDEIIITFHCNNNDFVVKECGYKIGYYDPEEEEEEEKGSTSTIEEPHHHLPTFRLRKGTAFLLYCKKN